MEVPIPEGILNARIFGENGRRLSEQDKFKIKYDVEMFKVPATRLDLMCKLPLDNEHREYGIKEIGLLCCINLQFIHYFNYFKFRSQQ